MNYIFDLDGTLALIDHRKHYVEGPTKDWNAFYEACVDDVPNGPVIWLFNMIYESGHSPYIFSGRSDIVREETLDWLDANTSVPREGLANILWMRPEGCFTPDEVLKERWYKTLGLDIEAVFDDRDKVVKMWRALGLTCLQVAEGSF